LQTDTARKGIHHQLRVFSDIDRAAVVDEVEIVADVIGQDGITSAKGKEQKQGNSLCDRFRVTIDLRGASND
jgi:hypothetical protein